MQINRNSVISIAVAALGGYALARGFTPEESPIAATPTQRLVARSMPAADPLAVDPVHTEWLVGTAHSSDSSRNVFGFREPPAPIAAAITHTHHIEVAPSSMPVAAVASMPTEPPFPAFPYRFLGTFGPRNKPFAAFARDSQVVNVRSGDSIDGTFVLRNIGIESVEIATRERPDVTRRLAFGQ